jgi:hypothetical protein
VPRQSRWEYCILHRLIVWNWGKSRKLDPSGPVKLGGLARADNHRERYQRPRHLLDFTAPCAIFPIAACCSADVQRARIPVDLRSPVCDTHSVLRAEAWAVLLFSKVSPWYYIFMVAAIFYTAPTALLCWLAAAGLKRNKRWGLWAGCCACALLILGFPWFTFAGVTWARSRAATAN